MAKKIWVLTIFPEFFKYLTDVGVIGRKFKSGEWEIKLVQLRDFATTKYKSVDDAPFGGGPGMIMRPDILKNALMEGVVRAGNYGDDYRKKLHVIYTSPRGSPWNNAKCVEFSEKFFADKEGVDLVFICGRYEGVDERFLNRYVDEEISVGDYVLSGGEIAVLAILDSALRLSEGVLGNSASAKQDSFQDLLLEHPQYTKPQCFDGVEVPPVLLSGHHEQIAKYQKNERERITKERRPDLFERYNNKRA